MLCCTAGRAVGVTRSLSLTCRLCSEGVLKRKKHTKNANSSTRMNNSIFLGSDIVSSHLEKYAALPFPNSNSGVRCHYPTSLSPLLDENSSYTSVARVCLGLSQYASSGCCATCDVCSSPPYCSVVCPSFSSSEASATASVRGSHLWNEAHVQKQVSTAIKSLTVCVSNHKLDSCRTVAMKCLALVARSAFYRARSSDNNDPLIVTNTPSHTIKAMEDECAVDVPQVLCNWALDDTSSDTVCSSAYWSLGILLCATTDMDDIMFRYTQQVVTLAFHGSSSLITHSIPTFRDMHHTAVGMDFQIRILSNVIIKRIRQLLHRASTLRPQQLQLRTLPFLTCCIQQFTTRALSTSNNIVPGMIPLSAYAKRWYSADTVLLQDDFVQTVLLPRMLSSTNGPLAVACSMSLIRLLCGSSSTTTASSSTMTWIVQGCSAACNVLLQSLHQQSKDISMVEGKANLVAYIIAATQALPWENQLTILLPLLSDISQLPIESDNQHGLFQTRYYHRWFPTDTINCSFSVQSRIGLLTECIVQMIIGCCRSKEPQAVTLGTKLITSHPIIASSLMDRKNLYHGLVQGTIKKTYKNSDTYDIHFAEELVLSITNTYYQLIHTIIYHNSTTTATTTAGKGGGRQNHPSIVLKLVESSTILLNTLASCLTWRFALDDKIPSVDEVKKLGCGAIGQSYLDLFILCLSVTGLIDCSFTESNQSMKQHNVSSLSNIDLHSKLRQIIQKNYQFLVDEGIPCKNVKIRLLHLFASYLDKAAIEPQQNYYDYARTILRFVGEDIGSLLLSQIEDRHDEVLVYRRRLLDKYISIVELTASSACDKLPGSKLCNEIIRLSLEALQPQLLKQKLPLLDNQTLQLIRSSVARIKQEFEKIPTNNESIPLWIFAVSKSEEEKQGMESNILPTAAEQNARNAKAQKSYCVKFSFDNDVETSSFNPVEMRRFLFWRCAQSAVRSRVSNIIVLIGIELYNDLEYFDKEHDLNNMGGNGAVGLSNKLSRSIKQKSIICLAVDERSQLSFKLSSFGASLGQNKVGSYPFMGWNDSIVTLSAASDPIVVMLSYSPQKTTSQQNAGGSEKPHLFVTVRIFNVTAVTITRGLRLDMSVSHLVLDQIPLGRDQDDITNSNILETSEYISRMKRMPLTCCSASYKGEIKAYDSISWEVEIDCSCPGDIELHSTVTFREVHSEDEHLCFQQVHGVSSMVDTDTNTVNNIPCINDDVSSTTSFGCVSSLAEEDKYNDDDDFVDVSFSFDAVVVPSVVKLLPCSLVFFTNKGDFYVFDAIWTYMSASSSICHRIQLKQSSLDKEQRREDCTYGSASKCLFQQASLTRKTEVSGQTVAEKVAWALMDWSGHRLLCRLSNEGASNEHDTTKIISSTAWLEMRCDSAILLASLLRSEESKSKFVADLTDGYWLPN